MPSDNCHCACHNTTDLGRKPPHHNWGEPCECGKSFPAEAEPHQEPCHPASGCGHCDCAEYWQRMINEGFWDEQRGCWTDKGMREIIRHA